MPEGPEDPRRRACDELARSLATPEGLRQARLLQLAGVLPPSPPAPPRPAGEVRPRKPSPAGPMPIGIWRPEKVDGELVFVRPDSAVLGDHWPPQRALKPKTAASPRRVCLLGESTAAGWFYAPHLTAAQVLEDLLRWVKGPDAYEVVNLTKVDLTGLSLMELATASLQLKPDLLVVFAGNNWPATPPDGGVADYQQAALAFREGGVEGLVRLAHQGTERVGTAVLGLLGRLAREAAVPVVVVVPEVNLADWERDRPVAWLPRAATPQWYAAQAEAESRMGEGDYLTAASAARRMVDLDRGTCAGSQRLLARAQMGLGHDAEAALHCRTESDSRAWDNVPYLPGVTSAVQEQIRRAAPDHGLACVDLPAVFGRRQGSSLTGRRLFLDYCHFTPEGMKVAMAAVAAEVLRRAEPKAHGDLDGEALADRAPDPAVPPAVEGRARFMTGLYNGRWNAPAAGRSPLAEYWLESALNVWPGARDAMMEYVATRCAPAEALPFSQAQQRVYAAADSLEHRVWSIVNLDPQGLLSIRAVLDRRGEPVGREVSAMLEKHHGPRPQGRSLLDPLYHWTVLDRYEGASAFTHGRCLFYRAARPGSHFCLVGDEGRPLELEVTARLPVVAGPREGRLRIAVNGAEVAALTVGPRWGRERLCLPPDRLRAGINKLSLLWPALPAEGDAAIETCASRLEQSLPADLHPVFGELFSLRARSR